MLDGRQPPECAARQSRAERSGSRPDATHLGGAGGTLIAAALLLAALVALAQEAPPPVSPSGAEPPATPVSTVCRYCRVSLEADDFCHWCGRLAGTDTMATESRFWGDVPYVIPFPPRDSMPTIVSELAEKGLAKETVSFLSGDRFTMTMGKQGPEVEGHVNFGRTAKESDLRATVKEMIEGGHLVAREIHGKLSGELNYHLYRRLDYLYTPAGLLDTIRFGSWYYDGASDREKKPGAWVRHAIGEIVLVREEGRLTRIETSIREGRRSLRGEPEYADPVVKVETIRRTASGAIDRLVTTAK